MEIRKTWTRSICFSVENHVHISKCLAVVERYWNLQVTWQRDDHCGDAFVFLSCLEKMHVSTGFPDGTGIVLGFFKQRQTKEK
jgi:hypothetical protein